MKRCILYIIAVLGIVSCEKEWDVDLSKEQKYVLYGVFTADSTWQVSLKKSGDILALTTTFALVNDATVTIRNSDGFVLETLLNQKPPPTYTGSEIINYVGTSRPKRGETYVIQAEIPNGPTLLATSVAPDLVPISNLSVDSLGHDGSTVNVKIRFNDPGNKKNYYQIKILKKGDIVNYGVNPTTGKRDTTFIGTVDYYLGYESIDRVQNIVNGTVFSDDLFNGKTNEIELKVRSRPFFDSSPYPYRVALLSTSEEYFRYYAAINLYEKVRDNPYAQPVQLYTNVENGLGLFGGFQSDELELKK